MISPNAQRALRETRDLLDRLRADGVSEKDALMGIILALQAVPLSAAVKKEPRIGALLQLAGQFVEAAREIGGKR